MTGEYKKTRDLYHQDKKENDDREEESKWVSLSQALGMADPKAEEEINQTEIRASLEAMLSKIKDKKRTVLEYRFFQDKTLAETAEAMGISDSTVFDLEHHALHELRNITIKNKHSDISDH